MNTTSESSLIELRIARAYGKLSSPVGASKSSVSLASVGNCEIRMFRGREADLDGMPLFWLELFDHVTKTSVDSFRGDKTKDAAAVFEDFMSQGANLNEPWDVFDPLAVAVDWLDAGKLGDLDGLLSQYDERATLECNCEGVVLTGRQSLSAYWAPKLESKLAAAFTLDDITPTGAPLQRQIDINSVCCRPPPQPVREMTPISRTDPASLQLTGHGVDIVERDLLPVNVEPSYDGHRDLLKLHERVSARRGQMTSRECV